LHPSVAAAGRAQVEIECSELIQLLSTGAAIEGFCMWCDVRWDISLDERADIARALNEKVLT
jgi:hypothetical protein